MTLLVLGVLIWSFAHLFPSAAAPSRRRLIGRIGEQPYKGVFTLTILTSIALMIFGWRSITPTLIYRSGAWGYVVAELLVCVSLYLFAASALPSNLRRAVRHPQLTGLVVWSGAHLLANGDHRSLVLFGGLGLWAILAMILTNHRDGAWTKPAQVPVAGELKPLVAAAVSWVALFFAHPYFTGVSLSLSW